MAITKERKEELVAQYVELLNQSRAIFLTQYTGLDVKQLQQLRADIRKADGTYHVTKNTLLRLAIEQTGKEAPSEILAGQLATGFAFSEVPTMAKTFTEFAKQEDQFKIIGGLLGDEFLTPEQIEALANLPTLEELRAQILGLIQAPARNIAATVASGVRQIVNVLDAYAKQENEVEPA